MYCIYFLGMYIDVQTKLVPPRTFRLQNFSARRGVGVESFLHKVINQSSRSYQSIIWFFNIDAIMHI